MKGPHPVRLRGEKLLSLGVGPGPKCFQSLCMGEHLRLLLSGAIGGVRDTPEFIILCP